VQLSAGFRLALLLVLAALTLACVGEEDATSGDVRVRVERVGLDANDLPVLLLEELGGSRLLPIWIGSTEAHSIARQIDAIETRRPDTHDLAERVIDGLRGEVERVVVTDLRDGTYYAMITLSAGGRRVEIDARPSDAVAIALRTGSPIFVRERLFAPQGLPSDATDDGAASI
jgi:bifunctional DNase/RNase